MTPFIASLLFVLLAEMGDKTQLLAMAFATRYPWPTVLAGVFAATLVNHLLAVEAGTYVTRWIPILDVQIAAALSFILFGLWTLRGDELQGEDRRIGRSPFWTVAIGFFVAEMGDKTQLATLALAARFNALLPVWFGSVSGMLVADGIGIIVGSVLGKRIPEQTVKWVSAAVFILSGAAGLYEYLPQRQLPAWLLAAGAVIIVAAAIYALRSGGKMPGNRR